MSIVVFALSARTASAQTTYSWNYSGTDPASASSWTPSGVPTAADTAVLGLFDGPTFNLPNFGANAAYGQFSILGPDGFSIPVIVGNGNTLTVGTGGTVSVAPLTYRGSFGTRLTLNDLTINIATGTNFSAGFAETVGAIDVSGFAAVLDLQNGSELRLINAANTANYDLTINGSGAVRLLAGTRLTNGVGENTAGQGSIRIHGGGILSVIGADDVATTFNVNQLVAASGHARVDVSTGVDTGTSGTPSVRLNAGNGTLQRGIDRTTRDTAGTPISLGTGTMEFSFNDAIPGFSGSSGQLFLAPGATGVPTQNGVITEGTSLNTNSPYMILTGQIPFREGSLGRFATINPTTGAVTAQLGINRDNTTLSSAALNENVVYRPTATSGANATLANNITVQTIVFETRASGQSVDLNGFTLTTPGMIVERTTLGSGTFTFSIDNGTIAGPGASLRNIFVLGSGSNTFFNVGATFLGPATGQGGGIVKSGTGTMVLTANSPQMNFGGDIFINQGSLRARIDGANANLGANNVIAFRGGTLEVDANGGTSTFTRSLGNGLGQVNWNFGTAGMVSDRGSGGFAAVNGNLDVNISGDGRTLVWNGSSGGNEFFLRSGQFLRLGSFQNNGGVTTLVNGLALDDGSAGLPLESRQLLVESPTAQGRNPAFRGRITGVISGSSATGLQKIGPAMLELTAANTYAGDTAVDVGALIVNNTTGSATGTGRVVVNDALLGGGTIAPASGNGVTFMPQSFLFVYKDQLLGTPANLKIGSPGLNNPFTMRPQTGGLQPSSAIFQLNGATFDLNGGPTSYSRLTIQGTGDITVAGAAQAIAILPGFTPASTDLFGLIDNQTANPITGVFLGTETGSVTAFFPDQTVAGTFQISYVGNITGSTISITGGNDVVLHSFVPVPEPASVLALSAGAVGLVGALRRVRRRVG